MEMENPCLDCDMASWTDFEECICKKKIKYESEDIYDYDTVLINEKEEE